MSYGKQILKRVDAKNTGEKGKYTFYLSKEVHAEFQKQCAGRPASVVLEEMMRHFIETAGTTKTSK